MPRSSLLSFVCAGLFACQAVAPPGTQNDEELPRQNAERDPTAQELAPGAALVDALSSLLEVDKSEAVADGIDVVVITATMVTPSGAPAMGETLELSASGERNMLSSIEVVTDATGTATATFASTKAESKTLQARVSGVLLGEKSVTFTPGPADPARSGFHLRPIHPRADGVDESTVTLRLRDAFDNPVPSVSAAVEVTGHALEPAASFSGVADENGEWSFSFSSTVAETKLLAASAGALALLGSVRFVDEWYVASGAPFGRSFRCVVIDAAEVGQTRIDVVTESGAWSSRDGGRDFIEASSGLPRGVDCRALLLDRSPSMPILYAAFADGRIFRRAHDEPSWTAVGSDLDGEILAAWLDTRAASPVVWIARDSSPIVMRLDDDAWVDGGSAMLGSTRATAFAESASTLYVATETGVFGKTDAMDWASTGPSGPTGAHALLAVTSGETTLLAATDGGVWRKAGSDAWVAEDEAWPTEVCTPAPCGPRVTALAADTTASTPIIYVATDEAVSLPGPPPRTRRARVFSRALSASSYAPLTRQAEVTYEPISSLLMASQILHVGLDRRGVFALEAPAARRLGRGLRAYPALDLAVDTTGEVPRLYLADETGLYYSDDEGDAWTRAHLPETLQVRAIALDASVSPAGLLVATDAPGAQASAGVWRSDDRGETFLDLSGGFAELSPGALSAIAYAEEAYSTDGGRLFLLADSIGFVEAPLDSPPLPATPAIWGLAGTMEGLALASDAGAFLRSPLGVWTRLGGDAFDASVRAIRRSPLGVFWFATSAGVYRAPKSSEAAELWDAAGLTPTRSFNDVVLDDRGAWLWAVAESSGALPVVYRFDAAAQAAAPLAISNALPAVSARCLELLTEPLIPGVNAKRSVMIGFDLGAGVYATSY